MGYKAKHLIVRAAEMNSLFHCLSPPRLELQIHTLIQEPENERSVKHILIRNNLLFTWEYYEDKRCV